MYSVEGTRSIMGTSVTITVVHPNAEEAKRAVNLAFDEMSRIEALMSVYKDDSEVSILNRDGFCENASPETIHVVKTSIDYSQLSGGAFSIAVLPLLDLWEEKLRAGRSPTSPEINQKLELVDHTGIAIDGRNIRFKKRGMRITLGAIAKGYAADRAAECLSHEGVKHALVNAGGDIRALGGKTEGVPWSIAVRDPEDKRRSVTVIKLGDRAVATSGNYERHIGSEMKVSHIIDGRTGQPAQELTSATIITNNAIDADALATIVFVLGPEKGMQLVRTAGGAEALLITNDGKVARSSGFANHENL